MVGELGEVMVRMHQCGKGHWLERLEECPFCNPGYDFSVWRNVVKDLTHAEHLVNRYPYLREEVERLLSLDVPESFR